MRSALILISSFFFLLGQDVQAQTQTRVFIPHVQTVQSAKGLIHTIDKVVEVPATPTFNSALGGVLLEFAIPAGVDLTTSFVSGIVTDENNQISMSPLNITDLTNPRTIVDLCEPKAPEGIRVEHEAAYKKLITIREKRLELEKKSLQETFSSDLFQRLRELEVGFHLQASPPLSLELAPEELAERLDILFHTIHRYEEHKKQGT